MNRFRTIISTSGTSVIENLKRKYDIDSTKESDLAKITDVWLDSLDKDAFMLSAELSTLKSLKVTSSDDVFLLVTDTDRGEQAAKIVERIAKRLFDIDKFGIYRIKSFGLKASHL